MKQVMLEGFLAGRGDMSFGPLEAFGPLTVYDYTAPEEVAAHIGDAEVVYLVRSPITADVIRQCPHLRYVGILATGFNMIDLEAAKAAGVTVCNVPAYSTHAVAQATLALLLEIVSNVALFNAYCKAGKWVTVADAEQQAIPLVELMGKTIGIVGMGTIGSVVGGICAAMGMKVLGYRRNPPSHPAQDSIPFVTLDELLAASDIVSIHCPLTDDTRHMVDRGFIAKMKDGAILLNTARGDILQNKDVADALDRGKLFFAGVDVLSPEPPLPDNLLLRHPRCLVTPHVAWAPRDTRLRLLSAAADNMARYLQGSPTHVVNA